jgi:hypothetical protein
MNARDVAFWHESEVRQPIAYVGYRGKTGKHLLAVSFTGFDPLLPSVAEEFRSAT